MGYEATSIEAIAGDAGVSKVTIYKYFGDKRTLFAATVEAQCERLGEALSIDLVSEGNIRQRLLDVGLTFVDFLSESQIIQFDRRIAAETEHIPEIGTSFLDAGPRRMHVALAGMIAHAASKGELNIDDPMLAAEQFASMCKGFGDLERRFGAQSDPGRDNARIKGAVETFLRAYSPKA